MILGALVIGPGQGIFSKGLMSSCKCKAFGAILRKFEIVAEGLLAKPKLQGRHPLAGILFQLRGRCRVLEDRTDLLACGLVLSGVESLIDLTQIFARR